MLLDHLSWKSLRISFVYVQEMLLNLFVYSNKENIIWFECANCILVSSYLTFGTQGNSFIIKVVAGSILDASLANDVVDSDGVSDDPDDDETNVDVSSSVDELVALVFPLFDPSSFVASVSNADCFVKLCKHMK